MKKRFYKLLIFTILILLIMPDFVSAAENAGITPDNFFYFVDILFEKISLIFTFGSENKAIKAMDFADERRLEAEEMAIANKESALQKAMVGLIKNNNLAASKIRQIEDEQVAETLLDKLLEKQGEDNKILKIILEKEAERKGYEMSSEVQQKINEILEASKEGIEGLTEYQNSYFYKDNQGEWQDSYKDIQDEILTEDLIGKALEFIGKSEEAKEVEEFKISEDEDELIKILVDKNKGLDARMDAARALREMKSTKAIPHYKKIIQEHEINDQELLRQVVLALVEVNDIKDSIDVVSTLLLDTKSQEVFGTAVYSLGQIKTAEVMSILVKYSYRFDSGSVGAMLVEMEDVILSVLENPQDENLGHAINATLYLYRDGQRETFLPLLRNLLTSSSIANKKIALDRLIDEASELSFEAEKIELQQILDLIVNQSELSEYTERIQRRLTATLLVPKPDVGTPTPTY